MYFETLWVVAEEILCGFFPLVRLHFELGAYRIHHSLIVAACDAIALVRCSRAIFEEFSVDCTAN